MIKAIIFDLGGVVYKTNWRGLNRDFRNKFGFDIRPFNNEGLINDKYLIDMYNDSIVGKTSMKDIAIYLGHKNKVDEIIRYYKKFYFNNKILNEEMINIIKKLGNEYSIYALTDINKEHYEADKEGNLFSLFKSVFTSYEMGRRKEDISVFRDVIRDIGLKPGEILFIDNHKPNIDNAKKIGMETIYYTKFPKVTEFREKLKRILNEKEIDNL